MKGKNIVLYCGMADDIISPIQLVSNCEHIYVIDLFDSAFAKGGTAEGQREDIRQILLTGNDENSHHREIHLRYEDNWPISFIKPHEIVSETFEGETWKLQLKIQDENRCLIYFQLRNFYNEWPEEIQNVNHLMCMGASFGYNEEPILRKMMETRTTNDCLFYDAFYMGENTIFKSARNNDMIKVNPLSDILNNR